jgi:hypothetical protein
MGKNGGHMEKYGGHMGKNGEPIYDLGHMGISLELNSGKIMADIWELPSLQGACEWRPTAADGLSYGR